MARVLVTGANGRLGRATCLALVEAGHEVHALARSTPAEQMGVRWTRGNILDIASYAAALEGCDAVIHYAAELQDPSRMDETNITATLQLLSAAASRGVRYFCFTSSVSVYGSPRQRHLTEDSPIIDPARPMTTQYFNAPFVVEYARTKAAAELAIRQISPGVVIDIIRPSVVRYRSELFEIGNKSQIVKMFMAPRHTPYLMNEDLAVAVVHLMLRGIADRPRIEVYNLADATNPTYEEIMKIAFRCTGSPKYRIPFGLPGFADMLKYRATYRRWDVGTPLGYQKISNAKLIATGFKFPFGVAGELASRVVD